MFRIDWMGRRGGGVLLYVKYTIPAYEIQLREEADCEEAIWCKLVTGHKTVTIYTIICLKSVCQRSQTAGRNSCTIVSGNVSYCSHRLTVSCHEFASQFGLAFFIREKH